MSKVIKRFFSVNTLSSVLKRSKDVQSVYGRIVGNKNRLNSHDDVVQFHMFQYLLYKDVEFRHIYFDATISQLVTKSNHLIHSDDINLRLVKMFFDFRLPSHMMKLDNNKFDKIIDETFKMIFDELSNEEPYISILIIQLKYLYRLIKESRHQSSAPVVHLKLSAVDRLKSISEKLMNIIDEFNGEKKNIDFCQLIEVIHRLLSLYNYSNFIYIPFQQKLIEFLLIHRTEWKNVREKSLIKLTNYITKDFLSIAHLFDGMEKSRIPIYTRNQLKLQFSYVNGESEKIKNLSQFLLEMKQFLLNQLENRNENLLKYSHFIFLFLQDLFLINQIDKNDMKRIIDDLAKYQKMDVNNFINYRQHSFRKGNDDQFSLFHHLINDDRMTYLDENNRQMKNLSNLEDEILSSSHRELYRCLSNERRYEKGNHSIDIDERKWKKLFYNLSMARHEEKLINQFGFTRFQLNQSIYRSNGNLSFNSLRLFNEENDYVQVNILPLLPRHYCLMMMENNNYIQIMSTNILNRLKMIDHQLSLPSTTTTNNNKFGFMFIPYFQFKNQQNHFGFGTYEEFARSWLQIVYQLLAEPETIDDESEPHWLAYTNHKEIFPSFRFVSNIHQELISWNKMKDQIELPKKTSKKKFVKENLYRKPSKYRSNPLDESNEEIYSKLVSIK
ncbi:hypothetical protein SNEBB_003448 [Seison nebaliae]|nr:hypothetical protein SNEBB_003448 [Seison nebaliae]